MDSRLCIQCTPHAVPIPSRELPTFQYTLQIYRIRQKIGFSKRKWICDINGSEGEQVHNQKHHLRALHDSSLSMMQLQKQGLNFAFKSDDDSSGAFSLSSRTAAFRLDGKAVDNILDLHQGSQHNSTSTRCHHQCLGWRMLIEQVC
jgi:hypothetical protein